MMAIMQRITYSEWLPLVMGNRLNTYRLQEGSYSYDENENANILTSFSTAALRLVSLSRFV